MTFIVRQISRTADGREIVRPQSHEQERIVVGRDASSEVHLADLAVELAHAEMFLAPTGRVEVQAVGGLGFDVDGRTVMRADIDPGAGAELRFGSHRLRISSDGGAVIVSVERVEALSDASEQKEEIGLFTLRSVLPGRRPQAWAFIGLILALFLVWPIYTYATSTPGAKRGAGFHGDELWSSGPLSAAHRGLENNCQACHTQKFQAVTDQACLTCHKNDAHDHAAPDMLARAMEPPGLFGTAKGFIKASFGHPQGRCVDCHTEHEGAGAMTPTAQQFCTDCHASLNERVKTKLADAGDFGTQHPQFQPIVGQGVNARDQRLFRRAVLAPGLGDDNGLKFPHDIHLGTGMLSARDRAKANGIARMAQTMKAQQGWGDRLTCKDCHTPSADGTRFKPVDMETDCGMCHSLAFDQVGGTMRTLRHGQPAQVVADLRAYYRSTGPARPIGLGGMARRIPGQAAAADLAQDYRIGAWTYANGAEGAIRAVFSQGGACYDCHIVTPGPSFAQPFAIRRVFQPDRYFKKGWFDHNAHTSEACATCHKAGASKSAKELLLPDLASCRTCHVGESGARLTAVKEPVESGCAMCHDYHLDGGAPWQTRNKVDRAKGQPRFNRTVASAR